jgi:putative ABC transport system permease protein
MKDYFFLAFNNLKRRRLRSWLTMIGIFIGIAAVISLISLGQGLKDTISEQFEMMGANKLIVMPGSEDGLMGGMASADKLTQRDLEVIRKVKGVELATEVIYGSTLIGFKGEVKPSFVIGITTDDSSKILSDMEGFQIEKGRELESGDRYSVNIGYLIAQGDFFSKEVGLKDRISVKGQELRVTGIMEKIGNPQDDSQIYIPIETARELFEKEEEIDVVYVQAKKGFEPADVAEDIEKDLRKLRDEKEGEETFSVQTFEQILENFSDIFDVVQAVLVGIAAISLLVGGVGIMNTMYTSVLERTKEIGTMKAVGAKNSDILKIFLFESGLLGFVGGAIGIGIGIGLSKTAEYVATNFLGTDLLRASTSTGLILGALAFSFCIGTLSGVLPAMQAAKLRPAEALRHE